MENDVRRQAPPQSTSAPRNRHERRVYMVRLRQKLKKQSKKAEVGGPRSKIPQDGT